MKYFIFFILILLSIEGFCQKSKTIITYNGDEITDSIYKVRTYEFRISNSNIQPQNIAITSDSAQVKKVSLYGAFKIRINNDANCALLKVYNKSKLVDSVYLYARKNLEMPIVHMSGKPNMCGVYTHLPYDLNGKGIVAQSPVSNDPENSDARYVVQSFTADIKLDGQYIYTEKITGPFFTEKFNNKFREGRAERTNRDSLILRYVVVKDELGNFYTVPRVALPYTMSKGNPSITITQSWKSPTRVACWH